MVALRLLLCGALRLRLGGAADEAAFLDLEPARFEDGLPEVEGDFGDALDGRDLLFVGVVSVRVCIGVDANAACGGGFGVLDLGGDSGRVVCWGGGGRGRGCVYL